MSDAENLGRVWDAVMRITEAEGVAPLNKQPGPWYFSVNDQWELAINGHSEPMECGCFRYHKTSIEVKPFTMYVEYSGWPAGILTPIEGSMAAGGIANIGTFADALEARVRELPEAR